MKYFFHEGCKALYQYPHLSSVPRAVLAALDVELVVKETNCCGYPARHLHMESFLLASARIMALARLEDLDVVTPCSCCFGNLKQAGYMLRTNPRVRTDINRMLREEDLVWDEKTQVKHLLTVLARDVGPDAVRRKVVRPLHGLKLAVHYGCQSLRPSKVTGLDEAWAPTIFERLVEAAGAEAVDWPMRLECCGHPVGPRNPDLSLDQMRRKINDARGAGAQFLCASCDCCYNQFETIQAEKLAPSDPQHGMGLLMVSQVLGLSLGIPAEKLGLKNHKIDVSGVLKYLERSPLAAG